MSTRNLFSTALIRVRLLLLALTPVASFAQEAAGTAEEEDKKSPLAIKPVYVLAEDYSDGTFGLGWELDWNGVLSTDHSESGNAFTWEHLLEWQIVSVGAWLEDEDLNRTPLTGSLGLLYLFTPQPPVSSVISPPGVFEENAPPSQPHSLAWMRLFSTGLLVDAGYEGDQAETNTNLRVSAAGVLRNSRHLEGQLLDAYSLVPTLQTAFDLLHAVETTDSVTQVKEDYARLRFAASWKFHLGEITSGLNDFHLFGLIQYSQDLDQTSDWEEAGFDEAFGWFAELTYRVNARLDLFGRISGGRIAPILEDDQSLLFGARARF